MRGPFKNWRPINWGCAGPVLVTLAVAAGIGITAVSLERHAVHTRAAVQSKIGARPSDPLLRELARCQELGTRAEDDQACIAAWRENRRRFFGGASANPQSSGKPGAPSQP
jgi:conjugative transfer region protein TrbK